MTIDGLPLREYLIKKLQEKKYGLQRIAKTIGMTRTELYRKFFSEYKIKFNFGVEIETLYAGKFDSTILPPEYTVFYQVKYHGTPPGYDIKNPYHWLQTWDGSLDCYGEYVSPILNGEEGLKALKGFCKALNTVDAKVDVKCGLHVHVDRAYFKDKNHINRFVKLYTQIEFSIDKMMPESRRGNNNRFCYSMQRFDSSSRYHKVNLTKNPTVELRQHGGTTDYEKISNWIKIIGCMIDYCRDENVDLSSVTTIEQVIRPELKRYYDKRVQKLSQ